MNFLEYGEKGKRTLFLIHGVATTAKMCYEKMIEGLNDFHIILCEVDGHGENVSTDLESIYKCCDEIEEYIIEKFNGKIYGLSGFSMGANMSLELIGRNNIEVEKTLLDAAFCTNLNMVKNIFSFWFCKSVERLRKEKHVRKILMDGFFGRKNTKILDIFYKDISYKTINSVFRDVCTYKVHENISRYKNPVMYWCGGREWFARRSAVLLKKYIPHMKKVIHKRMGHGQYINEHASEYRKGIIEYFG